MESRASMRMASGGSSRKLEGGCWSEKAKRLGKTRHVVLLTLSLLHNSQEMFFRKNINGHPCMVITITSIQERFLVKGERPMRESRIQGSGC